MIVNNRFLLGLLVLCLILMILVPMIFLLTQTEVGDIKIANQPTPVYESYQPGALGKVVCNLPKGTKVTIRTILTDNDLSGHEKTMFTGIRAFMIDASICSGWVLPEYLK